MKNRVKYLCGINLPQLTLAENTEINNLGRETPDLVIFQLTSNSIQTYVIKSTLLRTLNISG